MLKESGIQSEARLLKVTVMWLVSKKPRGSFLIDYISSGSARPRLTPFATSLLLVLQGDPCCLEKCCL